jgi:hypothetical protein
VPGRTERRWLQPTIEVIQLVRLGNAANLRKTSDLLRQNGLQARIADVVFLQHADGNRFTHL